MRHDLSDPTLIAETAASQVWRVKLSDGQSAVLKLLLKDHDEESRGTAYLSDLAGRGAVVVLYRDADMVLMEHCPGPSTGDLVRAGREEEATEALCAVIRTIHAASPDIAGLQPLAARFQPLTSARLEGDLADAARTACKLLAEPVPAIALHGDLHHDNVLLSPRG